MHVLRTCGVEKHAIDMPLGTHHELLVLHVGINLSQEHLVEHRVGAAQMNEVGVQIACPDVGGKTDPLAGHLHVVDHDGHDRLSELEHRGLQGFKLRPKIDQLDALVPCRIGGGLLVRLGPLLDP